MLLLTEKRNTYIALIPLFSLFCGFQQKASVHSLEINPFNTYRAMRICFQALQAEANASASSSTVHSKKTKAGISFLIYLRVILYSVVKYMHLMRLPQDLWAAFRIRILKIDMDPDPSCGMSLLSLFIVDFGIFFLIRPICPKNIGFGSRDIRNMFVFVRI